MKKNQKIQSHLEGGKGVVGGGNVRSMISPVISVTSHGPRVLLPLSVVVVRLLVAVLIGVGLLRMALTRMS